MALSIPGGLQSTRLGEPVFRPFVYVSLVCGEQNTTLLEGLVDTGADAVLASDLLAEQLGIDLADNEGETSHAPPAYVRPPAG